jgi:NADPH2:quinone reductase
MKAILIEGFGGPEQLKVGRLNVPMPGPDEVQIKIVCTAVNPVDWKIRVGMLENHMPHHFPIVLGWDAAGIISALGPNVKKFKIGDEVFAYCRKSIIQEGTYAEYICFNADDVALKPKDLSFAQAAAIPLAGLTAWQALFDAAKLQKGESVLIQAGAGGVGSLAIQFAKIAQARVITTARKSNHNYVKSLGADQIIDYQESSLPNEVKKFAPQGLDVVFDTLGGKALQESISFLKPGDVSFLLLKRQIKLLQTNLRSSPCMFLWLLMENNFSTLLN